MTDAVETPEMLQAAWAVSGRLLGWTLDVEDTVNEMADEGAIPWGYNQAPKGFFAILDRKAWKCVECDVWHPPHELGENEYCVGCRPASED